MNCPGSGGARGGGTSGRGCFSGIGGARIADESMLGWSISPVPSWALGTISERNLRSSVDSARELDAEDLFDLEKRPKKRETAEGARTGTSASDDRVEASILEMVENSARADIVADRVASVDGEMIVLGTTGIELSTSVLTRETVLARGEITTGEVGRIEGEEPERALDAVFRPKKDRKPPGVFLVSLVDCCGPRFSCETIRQPEGTTSASGTQDFDFTDASHDRDPLLFMYMARGL